MLGGRTVTSMARASSLMQRGPQSNSQTALNLVGLRDTDFLHAPEVRAVVYSNLQNGERGDSNGRQVYGV